MNAEIGKITAIGSFGIAAGENDAVPKNLEAALKVIELQKAWIAELEEKNIELQETNVETHLDARYCDLTGLPTRKQLIEDTQDLIKRNKNGEKINFSLLAIDLDGFKKVNDVIGHDAGDEVLKDSSKRMENVCGTGNVYRTGGDEFFILVRNKSKAETKEMVTILNQSMSFHYADTFYIETHFSAGRAAFKHQGSVIELMKQADRALYLAKKHKIPSTFREFPPALPGGVTTPSSQPV